MSKSHNEIKEMACPIHMVGIGNDPLVLPILCQLPPWMGRNDKSILTVVYMYYE